MVHRCCISSCAMNVRVVEAKGLSYHKFPTKEAIKDQWMQAVIPHLDKPESFKVVPRYTRVCSRHFRKKDYCMDAKKRARLNSNAVPSVFPRKNTSLVVQSVQPLPVSPKSTHPKTPPATTTTSAAESVSVSGTELPFSGSDATPSSVGGGTAVTIEGNDSGLVKCNSVVELVNENCELGEYLKRKDLMIESATIQDDHLVLTLMDSVSRPSHPEVESLSLTTSDDQSILSSSVKADDGVGGTKRRKRRKWNRTAFARPAKGKRKSLGLKPEPDVDQEGEGDDDDDEALGDVEHTITGGVMKVEGRSRDHPSQSQSEAEENEQSLNNVTLLLSDLPDHPYQVTSVEQELLQSIQAVSLRCVGEDGNELQNPVTDDHLNFSSLQLVPAFLHHHSSEESLFSNESQSHTIGNAVDDLTVTQPEVANEDDSLRFELVDLRIDPDMPPVHPPTYLDIDELAHQLNSSLITDGKIPLFNHDSLHMTSEHPPDLNLGEELVVTSSPGNLDEKEKPKDKKFTVNTSKTEECDEKEKGNRKPKSARLKAKTVNEIKKPAEKKLKGVSKRPKKDKISGKFSVERFKNSDKDIEYYTGFNSFRNFEAFFRSLEAYIERLCITDAAYGINNLPSTSDSSTMVAATDSLGASSTSSTSEQQPKKRSCQGRSMSRINELFMTIIRLRRKLPEKVLGHMFFISQPTVSRVVRAWTVLLSKIIDSYPAENSNAAYTEHTSPSKGLGIPDAFRDLFHSDLAKSIVVTSLNPKKVKSKNSNSKASKSKSNG